MDASLLLQSNSAESELPAAPRALALWAPLDAPNEAA